MKQPNRLYAFVLAIVFTSLAGCAGTATRESTGEYIADSVITTKVKAALAKDSTVKATEVNVETFKGTVQLSGYVNTSAERDQAVRLARAVEGVSSVKNDVRLK